jgi:hypothetical protein
MWNDYTPRVFESYYVEMYNAYSKERLVSKIAHDHNGNGYKKDDRGKMPGGGGQQPRRDERPARDDRQGPQGPRRDEQPRRDDRRDDRKDRNGDNRNRY